MNLRERIVNSVVVNKLGQKNTVVDFVPGNSAKEDFVVLDNGKKFGVLLTYTQGLLKYEDEVSALIDAELANEQKEKEEKLKKEVETATAAVEEERNAITKFREDYYFLSNMFLTPVTYNGLTYRNSEAAFQAQKDISRAQEFTELSGKPAKALGKQVNLRSDWNAVKLGLMKEIVRAKFSQNEEIKALLLATGDRKLVEGNNWHDTYWGVCNGNGENHLGKILMEVRAELAAEA